ncbi:MAG: hypothetical protein D6718_07085 [Acidobacteria bacterium]|nr:MAG: hypothetical protein D6718_07085 [Acidobacteriota bacterium]
MRSVRFAIGWILVSAVVLSAAPAGTGPAQREIWVADAGGMSISIIDPATDTVTGEIDLSDLPGAPRGVAPSKVPADPSGKVFVAQGSHVRVIDTATRTPVSSFDLAAAIGEPVDLRALSAMRPRLVRSGSAERWRTYLFAGGQVGTAGSDRPCYFVLDQEALVGANTGPVLVDWGDLEPSGVPDDARVEVGGVTASVPLGASGAGAWYALERRDLATGEVAIEGVLIEVDAGDSASFHVAARRSWSIGAGSPLGLGPVPSAPYDRPIPALPTRWEGAVRNLDGRTGDHCDAGGDLTAALIEGPGNFSYTVLLADRSGSDGGRLVRIDPVTCDILDTRPLSGEPSAMALLRPFAVQPDRVYVALEDAGQVASISLADPLADRTVPLCAAPPSAAAGPPPSCNKQPHAVAVVGVPNGACDVSGLRVARSGEDIVLTWTAGGACDRFAVYCKCEYSIDEATCRTLCAQNPPPGPPPGAPPDAMGSDGLEGDKEQLDGQFPWILLGQPSATSFTHTGGARVRSAMSYVVQPADE